MPMTSKEMLKFLKQNGSHIKLICRETGRTVIVPYHSQNLKRGMEQAYEMAVEALGLSITTMEEAGEKIPEASVPGKIQVEVGNKSSNRKRICFFIQR